MLIERIIELKLRGRGPHCLTYTSITGYFYDETKTLKENLRVDYYLSTAKMLLKAKHLTCLYLDQITYN